MLIILALGLASPQAHAQSIELHKGTPEFSTICLEDPNCETEFYGFLGHSMVEQGFVFQHEPLLVSAIVTAKDGFVVGGMIDTFPFAEPRSNLAGKEENTDFSPVLPRLVFGWVGSLGDKGPRFGAGTYFLPPIPVQGASSLVLGAHTSLAWTLVERVRIGPELGFTYTGARAPIVASPEQFADRENWDYPDNINPETYDAVCGVEENGCVDTFTVANTNLSLATSVDLAFGLSVHAKLGMTYVYETLWVMYDDTTWVLSGPQFLWSGGLSWSHDHAQIGLAANFGHRPSHLSEEGTSGVLFKLQAGAGVRF